MSAQDLTDLQYNNVLLKQTIRSLKSEKQRLGLQTIACLRFMVCSSRFKQFTFNNALQCQQDSAKLSKLRIILVHHD